MIKIEVILVGFFLVINNYAHAGNLVSSSVSQHEDNRKATFKDVQLKFKHANAYQKISTKGKSKTAVATIERVRSKTTSELQKAVVAHIDAVRADVAHKNPHLAATRADVTHKELHPELDEFQTKVKDEAMHDFHKVFYQIPEERKPSKKSAEEQALHNFVKDHIHEEDSVFKAKVSKFQQEQQRDKLEKTRKKQQEDELKRNAEQQEDIKNMNTMWRD